jgi:hypothetical protein
MDYLAGTAEAEVERMRRVLDQHLPAIFGAFAVLHPETHGKSRDELTERDVAIRAGYSAVHWIAKEIATGTGEGIYDLPSVVDLMRSYRTMKERAESFEGYCERYSHDVGRGPNGRYACRICGSADW